MPFRSYPTASQEYDSAKGKALNAIRAMIKAMREMGDEHVNFHKHFAYAQQNLGQMKNEYGGKELDAEVVRATALKPYVSEGNLPKVMAFGHMEMQKVSKEFEQEEKRLGDLQKETAGRVEALVADRTYKGEDEQ